MKEWEEYAKAIIREAKERVKDDPICFPLGWEEYALFNLEQELEAHEIFVGYNFTIPRVDMAQQIINNVLKEENEK